MDNNYSSKQTRKLTVSIGNQRGAWCHYDLDFDPKIHRHLLFVFSSLCLSSINRHEVSGLKTFHAITLQRTVDRVCNMTFDLLTPKSTYFFLSLFSIYYKVTRLKTSGVIALHKVWRKYFTLTLTFDPKIFRCLPFFVLHLYMKYDVSRAPASIKLAGPKNVQFS